MLRTPVLPNTPHENTAHEGSQSSNAVEPLHSRWKCSACTMWNSEVNVNCTMCMTNRPRHRIDLKQEQKETKQVTMVNPSISDRIRALFSKTPPQWACPSCTFVNRGIFTQCQSCWYLRDDSDSTTSPESAKRKDSTERKERAFSDEQLSASPSVFSSIKTWLKRRSSASAAQSKGVATPSGSVKEVKEEVTEERREGERKESESGWKCQQCTLLNPDYLDKCSVCDFPKDFEFKHDDLEPISPQDLSDTARRLEALANESGPLQLEPELATRDTCVPIPVAPANIPSPQEPHNSFTSSQGVPTWPCGVCGTFNIVSSGLRQCFLCGIGVIPESHLHMLQAHNGSFASSRPVLPPLTEPPSAHNQFQLQRVPELPPHIAESSSQDYVNIPPFGLAGQSHQGPSNHALSPSHLPTQVDHLHASSSLSPLHITSSDSRVIPESEPSYVNTSRLRPSPSPQYSLAPSSNFRDIPLLGDNGLLLDVTTFRSGHFHSESPAMESFDPYLRPATPPGFIKAQQSLQTEPEQLSGWQREGSLGQQGWGAVSQASNSGCYNRTKCLQARREEDVLLANTVYQEIERYSRMSGEPFTDPDFPPADRSLYLSPAQPVGRWQVSKWERPVGTRDDFDSQDIEWTVVRDPRPEDIAQGVLGNCWFLSALCVIAEQPRLIEDILITKKYCPEVGAYQVRLCKDGKWEVVVVDDCFPCLNSGELVFSKSHRKQLWVPLIEKALAKLYGSYEALNAGRVLLGLSVLTGLPCEKIHLKKPSLKGEAVDTDLIWARLLSFRERGFPMSASCGTERGGEEEESVYEMLGLESNHAYSILDVRQLGTEQVIRLRNPWGKYSWKGSWSDQDSRWETEPWLREELQAVGGEAGVFWMAACDFFQYFCEVDVCKYRPDWHSLRHEGKLLPFAAPRIETLAFEVSMTTEVDISIYQPGSRGKGKGYNLVDMAVLVLCCSDETHPLSASLLPVSCSLESGSLIQSIVTTCGFLSPGRYVILPLAFNHYRHSTKKGRLHLPEQGSEGERGREFDRQDSRESGAVPYMLAMFSAQELAYENVTTRPGFLPESLMTLAEKIGKVTESFPNMLLYEVYMKHSCRYVVAVNLDRHLHFRVTCNGSESMNVTCSRGELYTEDCIPPRHRQILWVLTQLEGTSRYTVLMKISSTCTQFNSSGKWGAQHSPPLSCTSAELHTPRLIND